MKWLIPLSLLAAAGCATPGDEAAPGGEAVRYAATSHDPFWLASIGDERVLLTTGPAGGRADGELSSYAYPGVRPSLVKGVRRWEAGSGTAVIAIEARPGPCATGGRSYRERVRVYLSGRTMNGCGGTEIQARSSRR